MEENHVLSISDSGTRLELRTPLSNGAINSILSSGNIRTSAIAVGFEIVFQ
jgi:hypothetical protein